MNRERQSRMGILRSYDHMLKKRMNPNKPMTSSEGVRLRRAALTAGFSQNARLRINGSADSALDFLHAAIKRKKARIVEFRISFDDVFGWDVGLRIDRGNNVGGIYGDQAPSLAAALIKTGLRMFGWDDGK